MEHEWLKLNPLVGLALESAMAGRPPVVIELYVEAFGGSADDTVEVDRDEWESMTPDQRVSYADGCAQDHIANSVSGGWHIYNPDDMASTDTSAGGDA